MSDIEFLRKWPHECCAEVTRNGESVPCDKVAVAVRRGADDSLPWPVCVFHTRVGQMVSLADLIKALS